MECFYCSKSLKRGEAFMINQLDENGNMDLNSVTKFVHLKCAPGEDIIDSEGCVLNHSQPVIYKYRDTITQEVKEAKALYVNKGEYFGLLVDLKITPRRVKSISEVQISEVIEAGLATYLPYHKFYFADERIEVRSLEVQYA